MAAAKQEDTVARFREDLEAAILLIEKFSPFCKTPEELIGMLSLAMKNDAQANLLMKEITPLSRR